MFNFTSFFNQNFSLAKEETETEDSSSDSSSSSENSSDSEDEEKKIRQKNASKVAKRKSQQSAVSTPKTNLDLLLSLDGDNSTSEMTSNSTLGILTPSIGGGLQTLPASNNKTWEFYQCPQNADSIMDYGELWPKSRERVNRVVKCWNCLFTFANTPHRY